MTEVGLAGNRFKSTIGYEGVVGNRFQSTIHCKDKIPNFETNIPRTGIRGLSPNFHIHASVSDL